MFRKNKICPACCGDDMCCVNKSQLFVFTMFGSNFSWRLRSHARHTAVRSQPEVNVKKTQTKRNSLAADGEDKNSHKIGECVEEARARRNKPSYRSIIPGVLQQSSQCNWAWTPKRMADFGRRRRQCSERHLPIHQRERARGASAETAESAAGTAGTTRRGASPGLESKPPVWVCQAHSEPTPQYDTLL